MASYRETARALAGNLTRLMKLNNLTQAELARRSGVGQSTISGLLDSNNLIESNPSTETLEKLAEQFGMPVWQLLIPEMPADLVSSQRVTKLVENYRDAPEAGRTHVDRVAEGEKRYGPFLQDGSTN